MDVWRSWALGLLAAGCSFQSSDSQVASAGPQLETSSTSGVTEDPSVGETTDAAGTTTNLTTSSDPSDTSAESGSPTPDDTTGDEGGEVEPVATCPEPLPEGWVLCEDFEDIGDPMAHFASWSGDGVSLDGPGRASETSLQITHRANQDWSGFAALRFGEGPAAANVARPDETFEELWVRFHTRVSKGWPVQGPSDLVTLAGESAAPPGATTFIARVTADRDQPQLFSSAFSCILNDMHVCNGTSDWSVLEFRGSRSGVTPVFGELAQSWSCVVMHARLNTPGQSDGVLEVLVGETLDSQMQTLDFRGNRGEFGFNVLSMPTFMEQPLTEDHERYIDDVVVSTVSLDCD